MSGCAFIDDDADPFEQWAAERDVLADPHCAVCAGDGVDEAVPCGCLVQAALTAFAQAAEEAGAVPGCARCDGDGEDLDGRLCPCVLVALRVEQELLEAQE